MFSPKIPKTPENTPETQQYSPTIAKKPYDIEASKAHLETNYNKLVKIVNKHFQNDTYHNPVHSLSLSAMYDDVDNLHTYLTENEFEYEGFTKENLEDTEELIKKDEAVLSEKIDAVIDQFPTEKSKKEVKPVLNEILLNYIGTKNELLRIISEKLEKYQPKHHLKCD